MSGDVLNWVYESLLADEEIIVPLKRLWSRKYDILGELSFDEFARMVLRDDRFEEVYSLDHDPQLELFGYFSGPRIKLRSRPITDECILRLVQRHNERVVQVLLRALQILREDPAAQSQEKLSEAVLMLEELRPAFKPWAHLKPDNSDSEGIEADE